MNLFVFTPIVILAAVVVHADATAVLLSLLREFQKESDAIVRLAGFSKEWCDDASRQNVGMAQALQGELDDASDAVQQMKSDEKRLQSELRLSKSTQKERDDQLGDAVSTSNFATAEFDSEHEQLTQTLEVSKKALRLLKAQANSDAQQQLELGRADGIVNSLLQTSTDRMTEEEKHVMLAYSNDPKPGQSQELVQTLSTFHTRVEAERNAASSDHQSMAQKLWSLTDRLNSSIMESKSQGASLGMEMAQRKRERTRLEGKISVLTSILDKVEANNRKAGTTCSVDAQHAAQIQKYITQVSDDVRTTLKKMPALSSELLFNLQTVIPEQPPVSSFLQVKSESQAHKARDPVSAIMKDLEGLANEFTEDSSIFAEAERALVASRKSREVAKRMATDGTVEGFASSSINDIYAYLKSDELPQSSSAQLPSEERLLLRDSGDLTKVTDVYQNLLTRVNAEEQSVDGQLKWCSSIARDAIADVNAVTRSLKLTAAKLNLVQDAISDYEKSVAFSKSQQNSVSARAVQLQKLAAVEDKQLQQYSDSLKVYGQQLLSLLTTLEQEQASSPQNRKGADVVRGLLEKVEKQQGMLEQWRVQSKERRQAQLVALTALEQAFAAGIKANSKRLVRLKVEAQALTSLASSKADDRSLSEKYVQLSKDLCSDVRAKQLQGHSSTLHDEAKSIRRSLTILSPPAA